MPRQPQCGHIKQHGQYEIGTGIGRQSVVMELARLFHMPWMAADRSADFQSAVSRGIDVGRDDFGVRWQSEAATPLFGGRPPQPKRRAAALPLILTQKIMG